MISELNIPKKKGIDIQGVIEQYQIKAGENISAEDFVRFIDEYNKGSYVSLGAYSSGSGQIIGVLLDNSTVFIAYSYNNIYGVVLKINNGTITVGTATSILNSAYYLQSVVALSNTKVMIITETYMAYCSISDTNITKKASEYSPTSVSAGGFPYIGLKITSTRFLLLYPYNSQEYYLTGTLYDVSNSLITVYGSVTRLSSVSYSGYSISAVNLNNLKFFIASGFINLMAWVCTVSGSNISVGTISYPAGNNINMISNSLNNRHPIVKISSSKAVIFRSYYDNFYLYGVVCNIAENTITPGSDTLLLSEKTYLYNYGAFYNDNYVFLIKLNNNNNSVIQVYKISNNTITYITQLSLDDYTQNGLLINNEKLLVLKLSSGYGFYAPIDIVKKLSPITSSSQEIAGVSAEDGTGGDTIDVYVPNNN